MCERERERLIGSKLNQVQDAIDLGANIRTNLGVTPQIPDKQITGTSKKFRGFKYQFNLLQNLQGFVLFLQRERRMIYHEQIVLEALSLDFTMRRSWNYIDRPTKI